MKIIFWILFLFFSYLSFFLFLKSTLYFPAFLFAIAAFTLFPFKRKCRKKYLLTGISIILAIYSTFYILEKEFREKISHLEKMES